MCSVEGASLRSRDLEPCLEGLEPAAMLGPGDCSVLLLLCVTRLNDCHGASVFVCWRISGQRPISPVLDSTSLLPASSHAHSPGAICRERAEWSSLEKVCDRMTSEFMVCILIVN